MPKKSHREQHKDAQLIAWYKWEFRRRNLEYRKNYEEFMRRFGCWFDEHGYWYDDEITWTRPAFRFFAKVIAPQGKVICERWQIRDPF